MNNTIYQEENKNSEKENMTEDLKKAIKDNEATLSLKDNATLTQKENKTAIPQGGKTAISQEGNEADFVWEDYLEDTNSIAAPPTAFAHVEHSLESGFKIGTKLEIPSADDASTYWIASVIMTCGDLLSLRFVGYGEDRLADFWFNIKSGEFHPLGWCSANNKKLWPPKGILEKNIVNVLISSELNNLETDSTLLPEEVEQDLASRLKVGRKLEIPSSDDGSTYWITSIIMICGELLSLRYAGYEDDRAADFWFNIKSREFHSIGWCLANNKKLWPPDGVLEKCTDIHKLIASELNTTDISSSVSIDVAASFMAIDQIKVGMKLEVLEDLDPQCVWIATIEQNVGCRLLLRYDGIKSDEYSFWLFYLSDKLQAVGYGKEQNLNYSPPKYLKHLITDWESILDNSFKEAENSPFPVHLFEARLPLEVHEFKRGMKLEAVNPSNSTGVCPATVTEVVNNYYFIVTIDGQEEENLDKYSLCCHSNSAVIFPVGWAEENGVELQTPKSYVPDGKFSWDVYLYLCNADAAPAELFLMAYMNMGFEEGMKCEAVDPSAPNTIKAATVKKIIEPLMWIHFDCNESDESTFLSNVTSLDIYPVGWCSSNSYPLLIPSSYKPRVKGVPEREPESEKSNCQQSTHYTQSKSWCPIIYVNHRCFTGPLLSKSRLAELPQKIGPGPVSLVLHEVITRIVNAAYKSSQVLLLLQTSGKYSPYMQQHVVKAKFKGKITTATVDIVRNGEQVENFCKRICSILQCCPNLFGPTDIKDACPSKCYKLTKSKFAKKQQKKPGRPPLNKKSTDSNTEDTVVKRGPGRRKKRKHWSHILQQATKIALEKAKQYDENGELNENAEKTDGYSTHEEDSSADEAVDCDKDTTEINEELVSEEENVDSGKTKDPIKENKLKKDVIKKYNHIENKQINENSEVTVNSHTKYNSATVDIEMTQDQNENIASKTIAIAETKSKEAEASLAEKKKSKHTTISNIVTRGAKLPNFGLWHHISFHSRRGRPRTRPLTFPVITGRKVGRPVGSTKKAIAAAAQLKAKRQLDMEKDTQFIKDTTAVKKAKLKLKVPKIESSPLDWSVEDVVKYVQKTECAPLAPLIKDQEIDGQAFLMLTKNNVQQFLHLKPEPAEKFCYLVKSLKLHFFTHYAT